MLIGGKKSSRFNALNIRAIKNLPSGFDEKENQKLENVDVTGSTKPDSLYMKGFSAYKRYKIIPWKKFLRDTVKNFSKAVEELKNAEERDARKLGSFQRDLAIAYTELGDKERAIELLIQARQNFEESNDIVNFYYSSDHAHNLIMEVIIENVELKDKYSKLANDLRKSVVSNYSYREGSLEDKNAYRIEQGELGFSSKEPMGTDNLQSCSCIILRDAITKKTALAHFDHGTKTDSLDLMFSRLPKNNQLESKLFGTRGNNWNKKTSQANLNKVSKYLKDKNVNVLSSDVLEDEEHISSLTVYPETFEVKALSPSKNSQDKEIATFKAQLLHDKPIRVAFDLTTTKERAPVLLTKTAVEEIRDRYLGKSDIDIYLYERDVEESKADTTYEVAKSIIITNEYEKQFNAIATILEEKFKEFEEKGLNPRGEVNRNFLNALAEAPIHIGINAEIANKPLVDFIKNDLFKYNEKDKEATGNLSNLYNFSFPEQPFTSIEAEFSNSMQTRYSTNNDKTSSIGKA